MTLESDAKFEGKITCGLENNMRNLTNSEHPKVSKLGHLWGPFIQKREFMSLKFTGELCVMTMKNDAKFEKELLVSSKLT